MVTDKIVLGMTAIAGLTVLEGLNLIMGKTDGVILTAIVTVIAGIAGFSVKGLLEKK